MEKLLCLSGINKDEEYFLDTEISIGRSAQNGICVADKKASRKHCIVLKRGDRVYLKDLDSTNGTRLNEDYIDGEIEFKINDYLKIGQASFKLIDDELTQNFQRTSSKRIETTVFHPLRYAESETTTMRKVRARKNNRPCYVSFMDIQS